MTNQNQLFEAYLTLKVSNNTVKTAKLYRGFAIRFCVGPLEKLKYGFFLRFSWQLREEQ